MPEGSSWGSIWIGFLHASAISVPYQRILNLKQLYSSFWKRSLRPRSHTFFRRGASPARPQAYVTCPHISVTLRMALRPDAARIPRKRMITFLTPSGKGPGPGLRGTADGYSPDIARTGTLRLRLKLCHKCKNWISAFKCILCPQMRNTLRWQSRSWSKLQHGTNAAWNAC